MLKLSFALCLMLCLATLLMAAEFPADFPQRLAAAKAGQTVELPAGEFHGSVTLPPGVSLRGAGYDKTIIDASAAVNGIDISAGAGAVVSDLCVKNAVRTNILAHQAARVTIARVRVTGTLLGVNFNEVTAGRVENVISDHNRYGIVLTGGSGNTVVNCTVAQNASVGLSFPSGRQGVAFNNVVTDSAICIFLGNDAQAMHIDHNLYVGLYTGKFHNQLARKTLGAWSYLAGQDAHSVQLPVLFSGPADFRPANLLPWSQERMSTSQWGVRKFAGSNAPASDIDGHARAGAPALGVYEESPTPTRPADGVLLVKDGQGLSSAGVFTPAGIAVSYLFHNLPLVKGQYRFWLPSRSYQGQPIQAGKYQVRLVESALKWEHLGWIGNSYDGASLDGSIVAPTSVEGIALDDAGHLIAGKGVTEDHISLRGLDAATGKGLWTFKGGDQMRGLTIGPDGMLYVFRSSKSLDEVRLIRSDPATGKLTAWGERNSGQVMLPAAQQVDGIAVLGERIYFADAGANKLWYGPAAQPALAGSIAVAAPSSPAADAQTGVIWLISGGDKVMALSPDGKVIAESSAVPAPAALAVRNGRLAVASRVTGKVHLFDVSDPRQLKPLGAVGRGDGPYGEILPDRFRFQRARDNEQSPVYLALGPKNVLVVADMNRMLLFADGGKLQWSMFGCWGAGFIPSAVDTGRIWDSSFSESFRVDSATKSWKPEAYWDVELSKDRQWHGDCSIGGKTFAVFRDFKSNLYLARYAGYHVIPVLEFCYDAKTQVTTLRKARTADGALDMQSAGEPLLQADGKPVPYLFFNGYEQVTPSGELLLFAYGGKPALRWPCAGLDAGGVPIYRWADAVEYPASQTISPYTFEKFTAAGMVGGKLDGAGGVISIRTVPGSLNAGSLLNTGGTDVMALGADGLVRWVKDMSAYGYVNNLVTQNGVFVAGIGETTELAAFNQDGLGEGSFCWPERANWTGLWYDHPFAVMSYRGQDGRFYFTTTDYIQNANQWFRLAESKVRERRTPLRIDAATAKLLAALPAFDPKALTVRPATPTVRIPRLAQDLPMDGDLVKWRTAGIEPRILITPDTSVGIKGGAKEASAVIRLAYRDGALYGQILRFCRVVVLDHPVSRAYLQDTVEMAINGFIEGFKFNITKTSDEGDIIQRQSWYGTPETRLPPASAPRIVKVLDNARDVEERRMIESIYGEDMSDCKVIVYEFKLPINKDTYKGGEDRIFTLEPGKSFWLGFMIDDNDQPGADIQNFLLWPATYGTFSPKEVGAIATCE